MSRVVVFLIASALASAAPKFYEMSCRCSITPAVDLHVTLADLLLGRPGDQLPATPRNPLK